MNYFIFKVAFRYFKAKNNEPFISIVSWFSLLGITLGVSALIVVMSVMNGFHKELIKNIVGLNGDINIISAKNRSINNYSDIEVLLKNEEYIDYILPTVFGQSLALGIKSNIGVIVRGISAIDLQNKTEIVTNIISGSLDKFYGTNVVALGSQLAFSLGVKVGDLIRLISPDSINSVFGSLPRAKDFYIINIFSSGMYDYDSITVLMPLDIAQKFFSLQNNINLIEVKVKNSSLADKNSLNIQKLLGDGFKVSSWTETHMHFLNALKIERVVMILILSLIVLVASFNIVCSLFMLVRNKRSDIAILRTIGATKKQIMLIFVFHGILIGLLGTIFGLIIGIFFSSNIQFIRTSLEKITGIKFFEAVVYYLYYLPSEILIQDVLLVSVISILLSLISTIYPAYKASKLNPVDILRYE